MYISTTVCSYFRLENSIKLTDHFLSEFFDGHILISNHSSGKYNYFLLDTKYSCITHKIQYNIDNRNNNIFTKIRRIKFMVYLISFS